VTGKPRHYVLDSFAVLAYLEGEAGMPRVRDLLEKSLAGTIGLHLSMINLGEALYIIERERGLTQAHLALAAVDQLPVHLVPATRNVVLAAAHVKASNAISYADAFAAATAQQYEAAVVTMKRRW
jgi:ribonuclease VapC